MSKHTPVTGHMLHSCSELDTAGLPCCEGRTSITRHRATHNENTFVYLGDSHTESIPVARGQLLDVALWRWCLQVGVLVNSQSVSIVEEAVCE